MMKHCSSITLKTSSYQIVSTFDKINLPNWKMIPLKQHNKQLSSLIQTQIKSFVLTKANCVSQISNCWHRMVRRLMKGKMCFVVKLNTICVWKCSLVWDLFLIRQSLPCGKCYCSLRRRPPCKDPLKQNLDDKCHMFSHTLLGCEIFFSLSLSWLRANMCRWCEKKGN